MNKIAVIITTFLRDDSLRKCLNSLICNIPNNDHIIIVDQGNKVDVVLKDEEAKKRVHYKKIPFNSGLSMARNVGVSIANKLNCEYVVMGSDSFLFGMSINNINYLADNYLFGQDIIGFELSGCKCGWEAMIDLIPEKNFILDFIEKTPENSISDMIKLYKCEIMRNFFIAKTQVLLDTPWDEDLKLGEHEDEFWRLKEKGIKCAWTDFIKAQKMNIHNAEYMKYRQQNFNGGLAKIKEKYGISGWVKYKHLERARIDVAI